jgi:uncharacterized membrane protein
MIGFAPEWVGSFFSAIALLIGLMLFVATVVLWGRLGGQQGSAAPLERALESLKQRLIQGQITFDEFERQRGQIEARSNSTQHTA